MASAKKVAYISRNDSAEPKGQSLAALNWRSMTLPIMMALAPPRRSGVRNEPRQGMNTRMMPETMPGMVSGSVTDRKVRNCEAPRSRLASR